MKRFVKKFVRKKYKKLVFNKTHLKTTKRPYKKPLFFKFFFLIIVSLEQLRQQHSQENNLGVDNVRGAEHPFKFRKEKQT